MILDLVMLHIVANSITLLGAGLMRWHRVQWIRNHQDASLEKVELQFLDAQHRRRMQASALLTTVGIMLNGSNEFLIPWQKFPLAFIIYICAMLALIALMVLLALWDLTASRMVHRAALNKLKQRQRELEHAMGQMRNFKDQ